MSLLEPQFYIGRYLPFSPRPRNFIDEYQIESGSYILMAGKPLTLWMVERDEAYPVPVPEFFTFYDPCTKNTFICEDGHVYFKMVCGNIQEDNIIKIDRDSQGNYHFYTREGEITLGSNAPSWLISPICQSNIDKLCGRYLVFEYDTCNKKWVHLNMYYKFIFKTCGEIYLVNNGCGGPCLEKMNLINILSQSIFCKYIDCCGTVGDLTRNLFSSRTRFHPLSFSSESIILSPQPPGNSWIYYLEGITAENISKDCQGVWTVNLASAVCPVSITFISCENGSEVSDVFFLGSVCAGIGPASCCTLYYETEVFAPEPGLGPLGLTPFVSMGTFQEVTTLPGYSPILNKVGDFIDLSGLAAGQSGYFIYTSDLGTIVQKYSLPAKELFNNSYTLIQTDNPTYEAIKNYAPDGLFVSQGPGQPTEQEYLLTGAGRRMFFTPEDGVFRAGQLTNGFPNLWDKINTGENSMAGGINNLGYGPNSFTVGTENNNYSDNGIMAGSNNMGGCYEVTKTITFSYYYTYCNDVSTLYVQNCSCIQVDDVLLVKIGGTDYLITVTEINFPDSSNVCALSILGENLPVIGTGCISAPISICALAPNTYTNGFMNKTSAANSGTDGQYNLTLAQNSYTHGEYNLNGGKTIPLVTNMAYYDPSGLLYIQKGFATSDDVGSRIYIPFPLLCDSPYIMATIISLDTSNFTYDIYEIEAVPPTVLPPATTCDPNDYPGGYQSVIGLSAIMGRQECDTQNNNLISGSFGAVLGSNSLVSGENNINLAAGTAVFGQNNYSEGINNLVSGLANIMYSSNSTISGEHNVDVANGSATSGVYNYNNGSFSLSAGRSNLNAQSSSLVTGKNHRISGVSSNVSGIINRGGISYIPDRNLPPPVLPKVLDQFAELTNVRAFQANYTYTATLATFTINGINAEDASQFLYDDGIAVEFANILTPLDGPKVILVRMISDFFLFNFDTYIYNSNTATLSLSGPVMNLPLFNIPAVNLWFNYAQGSSLFGINNVSQGGDTHTEGYFNVNMSSFSHMEGFFNYNGVITSDNANLGSATNVILNPTRKRNILFTAQSTKENIGFGTYFNLVNNDDVRYFNTPSRIGLSNGTILRTVDVSEIIYRVVGPDTFISLRADNIEFGNLPDGTPVTLISYAGLNSHIEGGDNSNSGQYCSISGLNNTCLGNYCSTQGLNNAVGMTSTFTGVSTENSAYCFNNSVCDQLNDGNDLYYEYIPGPTAYGYFRFYLDGPDRVTPVPPFNVVLYNPENGRFIDVPVAAGININRDSNTFGFQIEYTLISNFGTFGTNNIVTNLRPAAIFRTQLYASNYSTVFGARNYSSGDGSMASGINNISANLASHSLGAGNLAGAKFSTAIGAGNQALHYGSLAVGRGSRSIAENSFNLGGGNKGTRNYHDTLYRPGETRRDNPGGFQRSIVVGYAELNISEAFPARTAFFVSFNSQVRDAGTRSDGEGCPNPFTSISNKLFYQPNQTWIIRPNVMVVSSSSANKVIYYSSPSENYIIVKIDNAGVPEANYINTSGSSPQTIANNVGSFMYSLDTSTGAVSTDLYGSFGLYFPTVNNGDNFFNFYISSVEADVDSTSQAPIPDGDYFATVDLNITIVSNAGDHLEINCQPGSDIGCCQP